MINPIVIPCHNGIDLTIKAVDSCFRQTIPVNLMVIDHASNDGTTQWLWSENIPYMHLPNLSVSHCWNAGLEWAFGFSDHCLVINNDVELLPDTYERLMSYDGQFVTAVGVKEWPVSKNGDLTVRPHPDFSCFLIHKSIWDKVGPFDERYLGAYCEDCDYHIRMHRAGIKAVSINLPFLHYACGTIRNASPLEQMRMRAQADKNRELFRETYGCLPGTKEYEGLFKASEVVESR